MVISIRGTHGSGKSTIMKTLIERFGGTPIYGRLGAKKPEAYQLAIPPLAKPVFILGPYVNECGGCDAIQPYDIILELLPIYGDKGHVLFEGALVSSSYGRVGKLMERWGAQGVFAYLATPVEVCIARIKARREGRGDLRPLNTANTERKSISVHKSRKQVTDAGVLQLVDLNWEDAVESLLTVLRGADESAGSVDTGTGSVATPEGDGPTGAVEQRPNPEQVSFL